MAILMITLFVKREASAPTFTPSRASPFLCSIPKNRPISSCLMGRSRSSIRPLRSSDIHSFFMNFQPVAHGHFVGFQNLFGYFCGGNNNEGKRAEIKVSSIEVYIEWVVILYDLSFIDYVDAFGG
ncbi:3,9-dihydroxypterocarpan 6A-monooxygenase [Senna tora]|uniref:3,9-dihydroxypterocarpan 6A-monooxygenase n=1 Tax=Senna tora TaxID=362788 RepID=A0A834SIE9_9FABA|nr:3,9-dihydroxypterocarpan 6A-monooxygenase [Senna tora]